MVYPSSALGTLPTDNWAREKNQYSNSAMGAIHQTRLNYIIIICIVFVCTYALSNDVHSYLIYLKGTGY